MPCVAYLHPRPRSAAAIELVIRRARPLCARALSLVLMNAMLYPGPALRATSDTGRPANLCAYRREDQLGARVFVPFCRIAMARVLQAAIVLSALLRLVGAATEIDNARSAIAFYPEDAWVVLTDDSNPIPNPGAASPAWAPARLTRQASWAARVWARRSMALERRSASAAPA